MTQEALLQVEIVADVASLQPNLAVCKGIWKANLKHFFTLIKLLAGIPDLKFRPRCGAGRVVDDRNLSNDLANTARLVVVRLSLTDSFDHDVRF